MDVLLWEGWGNLETGGAAFVFVVVVVSAGKHTQTLSNPQGPMHTHAHCPAC